MYSVTNNLWVETWSQGIVDWSFTKEELLFEFEKRNIIIPEPLMIEWDNLRERKKIKRNEEYFKLISKKIEKSLSH